VPVVAIEKENVNVAGELAVLEAVVEQVDDGRTVLLLNKRLLRFEVSHPCAKNAQGWGTQLIAIRQLFGFGQQTGVVALRRHVDRNPCFARNEEGFIAKLFGGSVGVTWAASWLWRP